MVNQQEKDRFFCLNIRDCLSSDSEPVIGESDLREILSDFSSPMNKDVEAFLKESAIEFAKKHQSVTYLVFSTSTLDLVGYFSITVKPVIVNAANFSNTARRRLDRVSKYNDKNSSFLLNIVLRTK